MILELKRGCLPGIVPLMRESSDSDIKQIQGELLTKHFIETSIYHFNWSNNSLDPAYAKCLAFPVHGLVSKIDDILKTLTT